MGQSEICGNDKNGTHTVTYLEIAGYECFDR